MVRFFLLFAFFLSYLNAEILKNLLLDEALQIVEEKNIEVSIANFDAKIAKLGVKVAKGYQYGSADITMTAMRSNDAGNVFGFKIQNREASFADFGFDEFLNLSASGASPNTLLSTQPKRLNYPEARDNFDTKITYKVPIYTGGKLRAYREIAKNLVKLAKYDKKRLIAKKKLEVKRAFYDISLLMEFEKKLEKIKRNIQRLKYSVKELKKEGYAKRVDLIEVDSKLSVVERMLVQAISYKELSYAFLEFLLDTNVQSIAPLDDYDYLLSITSKDILRGNIDIKKSRVGYEIEKKMVKIKKSEFLPQVGAFVEYGSSDDKFLNKFGKHDRYTVGVQAKLNIFNGGVDKYSLQQEKLKKMKVFHQQKLARKGIILKFKKLKINLKNLNYQIRSLKKELDLSKEIYRSYRERYIEGLVSINDVLIKQSLWLEKLLALLDVKNKRNKKILEIELLAN